MQTEHTPDYPLCGLHVASLEQADRSSLTNHATCERLKLQKLKETEGGCLTSVEFHPLPLRQNIQDGRPGE